MRAFLPAVGNPPHQFRFDRVGGLSRRHAGAVSDTEDMRVDGDCRMSEGLVQHDIGGLAPDPRKRLQRLAVVGNDTAMRLDQDLRQTVDVLRLGVEQPDGADVMGNPVNPELDHRLRGIGGGIEALCRPIDPGVGCLRRQHDGDEKRIWIAIVELGFRLGKHLRHPFETGLDIGEFHLAGAGRSCHRFSAFRAVLESSGPASRLP